jgi:excinuclease ABC subunit A
MSGPVITLSGVRVHNLRGIRVTIPRNHLTVITGVSGSGKSSLAFDTLYAEGRRRYVESLSTYARQFLERMERPDLDGLDRVPPALAIQRTPPSTQARSTVGTVTEVHDYFRLLFARFGEIRCEGCGRPVTVDTVDSVVGRSLDEGGKGTIGFSVALEGSSWPEIRAELAKKGFARVRIGGRAVPLERARPRGRQVDVVVDRLAFVAGRRARLAEGIETAYRFGGDACWVSPEEGGVRRFSRRLHCPGCDREYRAPRPALFSPNSPLGACPDCQGFGRSIEPDLDKIIPDRAVTLAEGPVDPWNKPAYREAYRDLRRAGRAIGLRWNVPYGKLPRRHRRLVEDGGHGFYGIRGFFEWLEGRTYRTHVRVFLARYRAYRACQTCKGTRLRPEALAFRVQDADIATVTAWSIDETRRWTDALRLEGARGEGSEPVLSELRRRLRFLVEVGLGYLTLDRSSRTLSGGEAQRIQLARSLGSGLVDTLYVLDEPSIGLHPTDVDRLLEVLQRLRDQGNTVVLVEHDPRLIRASDYLIDLGPGAGDEGGRVLYQGPVRGVERVRESMTGAYLSGKRTVRTGRRTESPGGNGWIVLEGASTHNLNDLTVRIPRGALTVVTGISGSGKSSLVQDTLHGALAAALGDRAVPAGPYRRLRGVRGLAGVDLVDQSPIGRTPRSNPVTYVKAFDGIRKRLASTPAAVARGLKPGYFSFNVPGGRCDACEGAGTLKVEMHFLPDITIPCEACGGSRFGAGALEIRYRGRNVADMLDMTADNASRFFQEDGPVRKRLKVLRETGLGYLRLGQPAPTLSGGESQRLKLAAHLVSGLSAPRVFLLDEPTTGLHLHDLAVLYRLLRRLVKEGHTVVVVEHHLELVRGADWVIDLGPGGGPDGGRLVAEGTPERIARSRGKTGRHLAAVIGK